MTITGIIAEFNPFHNGHKYLLKQADGLKIVAMSGNFMQRGEPAIVDKWTRAQMALENGADLVVELPFLVSVQAADFFGQGAVDILARLGIDTLSFGTEEVLDYQKIANLYAERGQEMEDFVDKLPDSLSYPQKTQAMWKEFAGLDFSGDTPNRQGSCWTKHQTSSNQASGSRISFCGQGCGLCFGDSYPSAPNRSRFLRTLYAFCYSF